MQGSIKDNISIPRKSNYFRDYDKSEQFQQNIYKWELHFSVRFYGVKYIVWLVANKTGSLCGVDGLYNRRTVTVKLLFSLEWVWVYYTINKIIQNLFSIVSRETLCGSLKIKVL